jgi:hypothetical protein
MSQMRRALIPALLTLLAASSSCQAVTIPQIAGYTTIAVNALTAGETLKKAKAVWRKIHPKKLPDCMAAKGNQPCVIKK